MVKFVEKIARDCPWQLNSRNLRIDNRKCILNLEQTFKCFHLQAEVIRLKSNSTKQFRTLNMRIGPQVSLNYT